MYSIDKLSPNHVYQTSIAYFHIQESEPSATRFDQWHRTIGSEFNTAASHYDVQYMMKCVMQGDEIKIIKYKMLFT